VESGTQKWTVDRALKLGDVDVKVRRCLIIGDSLKQEYGPPTSTMKEAVPEKALKGRALSAHAT
jgi:hypothetical protein